LGPFCGPFFHIGTGYRRSGQIKTFRVTVRRGDDELTFKTEADQFRHDSDYNYSGWNIAAADRREFEKLFGYHSNYKPKEIMRIEYGKTVLYEADRAED